VLGLAHDPAPLLLTPRSGHVMVWLLRPHLAAAVSIHDPTNEHRNIAQAIADRLNWTGPSPSNRPQTKLLPAGADPRVGRESRRHPPIAHGDPVLNGLESWSMTTLPLSEVKARLSEIAEEVAATHERVQITKNGRDYVVLVAADDLESIEATLELLGDAPAQARVGRAEQDIAAGDVLDESEVRALLAARPSKGN